MKIRLLNIAFELTDKCNLGCRYCYNVWKIPGAERKSFDSYKKAEKALKTLFSQANVRNVTLTGGEPFMAQRMKEIALLCRMERKTVTIISNGSLGTEQDYQSLTAMGITLFEFPIHSADEAVHDHITQVKGSWQKSIASIKAIQKLGGFPVPVIVMTKYNIDLIGDTLDFISFLGLKRVMMNRYNIGGCGTADPASVSGTHSQLCNAFRTANNKAKELDMVISSNVCSPDCLINPADYPKLMFGHCSADVLLKPITMDINGNIRLCNHSPVVAGNIFEQDIKEILYSPYANSWNEITPEFCASCKAWEKCRGGCRAASEQCGLGLEHVDPILTETELLF
ncbi:radical SAM protein with 4Fe4S-binding SPASM domain [Dysgonomonas hofstadii]|uniref:Radical SAM protein with 4Fe4S-binding SPASM domain n=1 Tax=Dysgonomonas hofstadii TaxID=637886 RepID=A0A840CVT5_9BACT|nr:radical SAM protein [Dysgonomonas hofstadii]MBB4036925.1 radical SAM protein with 4Fe4S-binding SPASM domain [Dysgonomonas hofstadii]